MTENSSRPDEAQALPTRQTQQFHSAAIDTWTVQTAMDRMGTSVRLTLSRREFRREAMRQVQEKGPDAGRKFTIEGRQGVADEFEAVMEPHNAFDFAVKIIEALGSLPAHQRKRYALDQHFNVAEAPDDSSAG